jgi:RNA polymerase primary sigma factor
MNDDNEFEKSFSVLSRKEREATAEVLPENGSELVRDNRGSNESFVLDVEDVFTEIDEEDDFEVLYDAALFKDKRPDDLIFHKRITQSNTTLCKLVQQGSRQALQDLCVKNKRLVRKFVFAYRKSFGHRCDPEDLEQAGFIGLLRAARRYDPLGGASFSTYASYWIRQAISKEIIDNGFSIRVPVHIMDRINKVSGVEYKFAKEGYSPAARIPLIAKEVGFSQEDVRECLMLRNNFLQPLSLDAPSGEEDSVLGDFIPNDEEVSAEQIVFNQEMHEELELIMQMLRPREEAVLKRRLGWDDGKPCTLEEIGREYDLTKERIRQIEANAIKHLTNNRETQRLKVFWEAD